MSELLTVIKARRSTRAFQSGLPPKEQILQLVEAAEWAPSGMGKFLWHFTVIYNAKKCLRLARAVDAAMDRSISLFHINGMKCTPCWMARQPWKTCC